MLIIELSAAYFAMSLIILFRFTTNMVTAPCSSNADNQYDSALLYP